MAFGLTTSYEVAKSFLGSSYIRQKCTICNPHPPPPRATPKLSFPCLTISRTLRSQIGAPQKTVLMRKNQLLSQVIESSQ